MHIPIPSCMLTAAAFPWHVVHHAAAIESEQMTCAAGSTDCQCEKEELRF
jgi:hypothetical protein